jgi:hypothetical protein
MKNFLLNLFRRSPPRPPLVEYPSSEFRSIQEALRAGLVQYRELSDNRPLEISWQGQGGRLDSYLIRNLRLTGSILSAMDPPIQWEAVCRDAGFDYAKLKTDRSSELDVQSLSTEELATLIEFVFVKHLAMKPWDDSHDFCLGMEYVENP